MYSVTIVPSSQVEGSTPDISTEALPEEMDPRLAKLLLDVQRRGLMALGYDDNRTQEELSEANLKFSADPALEGAVIERLQGNNGERLLQAAGMQGGGEIIGRLPDGKLLAKDRGPHAVFYIINEQGKPVPVTTDHPEREALLRNAIEKRSFATCRQIVQALRKDRYILPPPPRGMVHSRGNDGLIYCPGEIIEGQGARRFNDTGTHRGWVAAVEHLSRSSFVEPDSEGRGGSALLRPDVLLFERGIAHTIRHGTPSSYYSSCSDDDQSGGVGVIRMSIL